jgi:4-hydroxy-3-methylbut-2-enyl diphosphate reductase
VVDAVCPLVTKVHHEADVRARKGYTILYVGHAGHDEAVGTLAVAPDRIRLIEHEHDLHNVAAAVDDPTRVALLAQTTLALHDWEGIMDDARGEFPELWTASRDDLCFATTNRQAALREIAQTADAVVVIGSSNSSNTIALAKVAGAAGCAACDPTGASATRWGVSIRSSAPRREAGRSSPAKGATWGLSPGGTASA